MPLTSSLYYLCSYVTWQHTFFLFQMAISMDLCCWSFLIGFQGALVLQAESFKQSTFNDRIRTIFMKLLIEEIDVLDDFHKYGKIKGWLNTPPGYGSQ